MLSQHQRVPSAVSSDFSSDLAKWNVSRQDFKQDIALSTLRSVPSEAIGRSKTVRKLEKACSSASPWKTLQHRLFLSVAIPSARSPHRTPRTGVKGTQSSEIISWCPAQPRKRKNGSELVFHKVSWTLEEASNVRNCWIIAPPSP